MTTPAYPTVEYAFFPTPLGPCGIAWSKAGLIGIHLPEASLEETRRTFAERVAERVVDAPGDRRGAREVAPTEAPESIRKAIDAIARQLAGEPQDLGFVTLDLTGIPELHRRIYAVTRSITAGETLTYGEVATRIAASGAARVVGQALGRNPFPIVVPCHRVLAAGGRDGGFSAPGGVATKRRLLALEGVRLAPQQMDLVVAGG